MIETNKENDKRQMKAVSKAIYRKVVIMTTQTGFSFFFGTRQYNCQSLGEATAAIDAIYARVARVLLTGSDE